MPHNYLHLGLIAVLFPRGRIIHCRRDPMDVCASAYFQNFKWLPYAASLEDIAFYHRQYERLMAHWRRVLPMPMHEVVYEELVANQEAVSRELVAFCGLDWDDRCLTFYKSPRAVQTASKLQVRQPIYTPFRGPLETLRGPPPTAARCPDRTRNPGVTRREPQDRHLLPTTARLAAWPAPAASCTIPVMPLTDLNLFPARDALPGDVRAFLREANRRIERLQRERHIPGFVPSDFTQVYGSLRAVAEEGITPGKPVLRVGQRFRRGDLPGRHARLRRLWHRDQRGTGRGRPATGRRLRPARRVRPRQLHSRGGRSVSRSRRGICMVHSRGRRGTGGTGPGSR